MSATTSPLGEGLSSWEYWKQVQCPDCSKIAWIGGLFGQKCGHCGYVVGFGDAKRRPTMGERCWGSHLWTHVPVSEEYLNRNGDIYKCYYCQIEA